MEPQVFDQLRLKYNSEKYSFFCALCGERLRNKYYMTEDRVVADPVV
jgi:hypothetical protein